MLSLYDRLMAENKETSDRWRLRCSRRRTLPLGGAGCMLSIGIRRPYNINGDRLKMHKIMHIGICTAVCCHASAAPAR